MSIFDYFVSKTTDEQERPERKAFSPTPYKKLFSGLEASAEEVKKRFPDDSKTVDDFLKALKSVCKARSKKALDGRKRRASFSSRRTG